MAEEEEEEEEEEKVPQNGRPRWLARRFMAANESHWWTFHRLGKVLPATYWSLPVSEKTR